MPSNEEPQSLENQAALMALDKIDSLETWAREFQTAALEMFTRHQHAADDVIEWSNDMITSLQTRDTMVSEAFTRLSLRLEALEMKAANDE